MRWLNFQLEDILISRGAPDSTNRTVLNTNHKVSQVHVNATWSKMQKKIEVRKFPKKSEFHRKKFEINQSYLKL